MPEFSRKDDERASTWKNRLRLMGSSALAPAEYQDLHAQKVLAASAAEAEDRERRGREQEDLAAAAGNRRMNENDLRQCEGESLPDYFDRLKRIQATVPPPHAAAAAIAVRMAMRRANARLRAEHGRAEQMGPTTPLQLLHQAWEKASAAERAEFLSDMGAGGAVD
jgi:hypothetical protein